MEKINFQDLPSTSTPLSSTNLNQMQDNMEDAIIPIKLVSISDTAPGSATTGDMYYNTTDNKVYIATGTNTWDSGSTPRYDGFYINTNDNTLFYYNGTSLVGVGGSQTSINVKNVETDSTSDVYSCDYINDLTNMFDYSNEQIVGKWADGKPLYQKVFVVTDQNNINFDVSSLNIDTCCKLECVIDYVAVSNNYRYRRPIYCSTENQEEYFLAFLRDNTIQTRISSYLSSAIETFNKITYVLTYTKTTD